MWRDFVFFGPRFVCVVFLFFSHGAAEVYLSIRLRARDFYAVIVDEGEARINYQRIEFESE